MCPHLFIIETQEKFQESLSEKRRARYNLCTAFYFDWCRRQTNPTLHEDDITFFKTLHCPKNGMLSITKRRHRKIVRLYLKHFFDANKNYFAANRAVGYSLQ
jgi:hypothetical protein